MNRKLELLLLSINKMDHLFSKEYLKELVRRNWPLRMVVLLFLMPKRFMNDFVYSFIDYRRFKRSVAGFKQFLLRTNKSNTDDFLPGLLLVAGNAMNVQWCQLWAVMSGVYSHKNYNTYVLTSKNEPIRNIYFRLFGVKFIYIEDLQIKSISVPSILSDQIAGLETFKDFKEYELDDVPLGKMALSTYGRLKATGVINVSDPEVRVGVKYWVAYLYQTLVVSKQVYEKYNIKMLFFTEVFMEEYGAFYYGALHSDLNILRFAGTVRDDAIIAHHLTMESDRTHHAAVTPESWERICSFPESSEMYSELEQNFLDRYGDRWALSKRNQPNTRIMLPSEARKILGVSEDRKIAVIYSHILYDTLFFFGEDLFPCYADWFVETVKVACLNPEIQWFVKVHPSNLWRGELEHFFGGEYEEVLLIRNKIGELPDHVTMVYPDTPISPYSWFQITDYGITVRGTSGIDMGALGKSVVTAGSGRYEKIGFTINPKSATEYLNLLSKLHTVSAPTEKQRQLGARFAYATFCMKPYTMDYLKPVPRTSKSDIFSSDDLVYLGNFSDHMTEIPYSLERFVEWTFDRDNIDFLNEWPGIHKKAASDIDSPHNQMVALGGE